ncbi:MAG: hypothetical protein IJT41_01480, partial [Clostridia bacterium]|nr:hypothetical protein [Clostridia bacterium]
VEEATPSYSNALPSGFSLDKTGKVQQYEYDKVATGYTDVTPAAFDWGAGNAVETAGSYVSDLSVTPTSATMTVKNEDGHTYETYDAMLHIFTRTQLTAGQTYRVTLKVAAAGMDNPFDYDMQYGSGYSGSTWDNDVVFAYLNDRRLAPGKSDTVECLFTAGMNGALMITVRAGNAEKGTITVSDLSIEHMNDRVGYAVKVPSTNRFNVEGNQNHNFTVGSDITHSKTDSYARVKRTADPAAAADAELRLEPQPLPFENGRFYRIKLDVWADRDIAAGDNLNFRFGKWSESITDAVRDTHGTAIFNQTLTANQIVTIEKTFLAAKDVSQLLLFVECGHLPNGAEVTVCNLRIEQMPNRLADDVPSTIFAAPETLNVDYPTAGTPSTTFGVRVDGGHGGSLTGDGESATLICSGGVGSAYQRGLFFTKDDATFGGPSVYGICYLAEDSYYEVSFDIKTKNAASLTFDVCNGRGGNWDDHEGRFGTVLGLNATTEYKTIKYIVYAANSQGENVRPRLDVGQADTGEEITVRNISVRKLTDSDPVWAGTNVLPAGFAYNLGTCVKEAWSYTHSALAITPGSAATGSAAITVTDPNPPDAHSEWRGKIELYTGFVPEAGKDYRVSFDIAGTAAQNKFFLILYGYYGGPSTEKIYGEKYEQSVTTAATTIPHVISKNGGTEPLMVEIQLGNVNATNTFTVSNLKIEEVHYAMVPRETDGRITGTVYSNLQPGYGASLSRTK